MQRKRPGIIKCNVLWVLIGLASLLIAVIILGYTITTGTYTRPARKVDSFEEAKITRTRISSSNASSVRSKHDVDVISPTTDVDFKAIIQHLYEIGSLSPAMLLTKLESDPFRTRLGPDVIMNPGKLGLKEDSAHFGSIYQRWADTVNTANDYNAERFRKGDQDAFIFYQHLRKAGGTGFCDMATKNMNRRSVPSYYCMPDNKGSLASPPWRNASYLLSELRKKGHRIAANEWDAFYSEFVMIPGVVLATTFRNPVDRWYSQYKFEHLEHRDGSKVGDTRKPMYSWYRNQKTWTMGANYYVKTFSGEADHIIPSNYKGDFYWTYHKFNGKPITLSMLLNAVNNIRKFNLILVTEWMESSHNLTKRILGWTTPPKRVLPHEVQAMRHNKTSSKAKDMLSADDYQKLCEENAFDLLFFEIVKRIYLERLAENKRIEDYRAH